MDLETQDFVPEFLATKLGEDLGRKIPLYLSSPTAELIFTVNKNTFEGCDIKTTIHFFNVIHSNEERIGGKRLTREIKRMINNNSILKTDPTLSMNDVIDLTRTTVIAKIAQYKGARFPRETYPLAHTVFRADTHTKDQLLTIAKNLGCRAFKSWTKTRIIQAIYPNLPR